MSGIKAITKGQQLIKLLESYGVDTVFGIPGVHTLELYRGLAASNIQHITPRHEQGAGFMADGYARITGKPGVCFVITGPGLTNITTAMGQALGDSIPMLVISTVNAAGTETQGCLHAMPQQANVVKPLTVASFELNENDNVPDTLAQVFAALNMHNGTPLGPVHLQIPLDVIGQLANDNVYEGNKGHKEGREASLKALDSIQNAAYVINQHKQIVILAGGGAVNAQAHIKQLAQVLDAPVVTTINARGLLANHALSVPASPSLEATRSLLAQADCVIALGTQMGQTDYDMYVNGQFPPLHSLIRIDINPAVIHQQQLQLGILGIHSDVSQALTHLLPLLEQKQPSTSLGEARASATRHAAFAELPKPYQQHHNFLTAITTALPEAIIVGDSTQPVYGGNCYFEPPAPKTWFNSATGFGTLGYALPAAIGAALGRRLQHNNHPIIALTGDGGLQFCLAELATAKDFELPIIFIVWNNQGYGEIESSMLAVGVTPIGVSPMPPILDALALAYGLKYIQLVNVNDLSNVLQQAAQHKGPMLLEINEPQIMSQLETMATCNMNNRKDLLNMT